MDLDILTRNTLINIFKEDDIDYLFCVCNAAGLSAFHFIERRMAPLSAALSWVVLPHAYFGSNLDDQGNPVDDELELRNFQKADELLCELWNNISIDNHSVKCSYRLPSDVPQEVPLPSPEWVENHCYIAKYCLQIKRCDDGICCNDFWSSLSTMIKTKFLPGPLLLKRSQESGIQLPKQWLFQI